MMPNKDSLVVFIDDQSKPQPYPLIKPHLIVFYLHPKDASYYLIESSIENIKLRTHTIQLIQFDSFEDAKPTLTDTKSLAIVVLSEGLESSQGYQSIGYIRRTLKNYDARIVMKISSLTTDEATKQFTSYDINGYIYEHATSLSLDIDIHSYVNAYLQLTNDPSVVSEAAIPVADRRREAPQNRIKILVVDDDPDVLRVTELSLKGLNYKNYCITYLFAFSAKQAIEILNDNADITLVILDMMMETDTAGIDVIDHIRKIKKLSDLRIILRTGESGRLNVKQLITDYDINDFKLKSEVSADSLYSAVYTSLRNHEQIVELRTQKEMLGYYAGHDHLTGLPNRRIAEEVISLAIKRSNRTNNLFALLQLDLDHFKHVNDLLGHDIGDKLLVAVAKRLKGLLREVDVAARQGGDEFIILLNDVANHIAVFDIAERILVELKRTFIIDAHAVDISASIGIAFSGKGKTASKLLKEIDLAMYEAKATGRNSYRAFSENFRQKFESHLVLNNAVKETATNEQFRNFYQPIVSLNDNQIVGFEVLLRWPESAEQIVHPNQFIPVLEKTKLIEQVTRWQIKEVIEQLKIWRTYTPNHLYMAINLSPVLLQNSRFYHYTAELIEKAGIKKGELVLEITEGLYMDDLDNVRICLEQYQSLGVDISIDDFGTGYSSLSYLNNFPVDCLKVDREFITNISKSDGDEKLISIIIEMSRILGHKSIVFEGVETVEQLAWLKQKNNAGLYQGYLYSKPKPAEEIEALFLYPMKTAKES